MNKLLSASFLYPFSRVTYCAYLVHPVMIRIMAMRLDSPMHLSLEIIVCIQLFILSKQNLIICVTVKETSPLAVMIKWKHNSNWGHHSSVSEDSSLVGCDAVLLVSSSQCLDRPFDPDDESTMILRIIAKSLSNTADHIPKSFLLHIWTTWGCLTDEAVYVIALGRSVIRDLCQWPLCSWSI